MSEYQKLSHSISELQKQNELTNRSLDALNRTMARLLTWAEGDKSLGSPSVQQKIDANAQGISDLRKKVYDSEDTMARQGICISNLRDDIRAIKTQTGIIGAGSGGIIVGVLEIVKHIFGL